MANRAVIKTLYPIKCQAASLKIHERIVELMEMKRWDKAKLANALGLSRPMAVKQFIGIDTDYTISTIIALEQVLGGKIIEVISVNELT